MPNVAIQQSADLQSFITTLPERPYWSRSKRLGRDCFTTAERAANKPYIQLNAPWMARHIRFDVDREGAAWAWDDAGLPAPTHVVVNPENGHATYVYTLSSPIPKSMSRKTKRLLDDVLRAYKDLLGADAVTVFQRQLVKNPFYGEWRTIHHGTEYTLAEMAGYLPARRHVRTCDRPKRTPSPVETLEQVLDPGSRNRTLFEAVRRHAYAMAGGCGDRTELFALVHSRALELNGELDGHFPRSLDGREVQHVARSVTNWTWERRRLFGGKRERRRGVMGLPKKRFMSAAKWTAEVKRRQSLGAGHTHKTRSDETEYRVTEAIGRCLADGVVPNKSLVAGMTGLSRRTVIRHGNLFEGTENRTVPGAVLPEFEGGVTFGVNQDKSVPEERRMGATTGTDGDARKGCGRLHKRGTGAVQGFESPDDLHERGTDAVQGVFPSFQSVSPSGASSPPPVFDGRPKDGRRKLPPSQRRTQRGSPTQRGGGEEPAAVSSVVLRVRLRRPARTTRPLRVRSLRLRDVETNICNEYM